MRKLFFLLILCSCVSNALWAQLASGKCGTNLTWSLSEDYTLTISGEGEMYYNLSQGTAYVPWYSYKSKIVKVCIGDEVTNIYNYAFSDCKVLETVNIPNSVTTLGNYVFERCSKLSSINSEEGSGICNIPNTIKTVGKDIFYQCSAITTVIIPDSWISIPQRAFAYCTSLTSVVIPTSVTSIGEWSFSSCTSLKEIHTLNVAPPKCNSNSFQSCNINQVMVYVPKGSKEFYTKADVWKDFPCIIEEGESEEVENLKAQIKTLEALNASLQSENTTLKTQITTLTTENAALKTELDEYSKKAVYDINGDKKVTITDVTTLIDVIVNQ